jgi:ribonuclease P protein subunit RPR2
MLRKKRQKDLARQRIKMLFDLAIKNYKYDREFSSNCIRIAYKIKKKFNIRLPKNLRSLYCKKCYNLLIPPDGVKIRIHGKGKKIKIVKICNVCNRIIREELERFR